MNSAAVNLFPTPPPLTGLQARSLSADAKAGGLRAVAQEFESLFLQMMLKSMRSAGLGESLFDSDQATFYRELYDQKMAQSLSKQNLIGIADMLVKQLQANAPDAKNNLGAAPPVVNTVMRRPIRGVLNVHKTAPRLAPSLASKANLVGAKASFASPHDFVQKLLPAANKIGAQLGIEPVALLAQAALETGWGRHIPKTAQQDNSHNLFGIKAGSDWPGAVTQRPTVEIEQGVAVKKSARFRVYASYQESFADYVKLLQAKPRYGQALEAAIDPKAFFNALQDAGYASDPNYATKVLKIMDGDAMQTALSGLKESAT